LTTSRDEVPGELAIWPSWYKDMGVAPINVAVAEQYEALMRGTLDATIYPIYTIETYKFYEVCKYLTLPGFVDPLPVTPW